MNKLYQTKDYLFQIQLGQGRASESLGYSRSKPLTSNFTKCFDTLYDFLNYLLQLEEGGGGGGGGAGKLALTF